MEYDPAARSHLLDFQRFVKGLYAGSGSFKRPDAQAFGFGIEEEYFLADARTKRAAFETPDHLFTHANVATEGRIAREFLQNQVEVATPPYATMAEARAELSYIRSVLATMAAEHGLAILACGTHPTARWRHAVQSEKERYDEVMNDLQMIGQRNMLCGMHVHVEVPDPDRRVDIMSRIMPYLPLMLALSTSSPFWQSHHTGLKGYRLAAYDELPRTGLPELFRTAQEFDAYVAALVRSGVMEDSSYLWWMIRPSVKYPTLELRAPDCCTRLDDAVAIAALYRALVRHLYFHRERNGDLDVVDRAIAVENKWRAQRYGVGGTFVSRDGAVTVGDLLDEVIAMTTEDVEILGCSSEIAHCRTIAAEGTSADAQIAVFESNVPKQGVEAALTAVAEWIADNTLKF
ncbi:carboxylate-amine ligase [Chelatococcus sp. GCM10030263]|uniref:carboxylate-amine ligase n=1 Tax=Chelatococcus sp. GCM10030263 TaxID=3273387 RepID=UPI0036156E07